MVTGQWRARTSFKVSRCVAVNCGEMDCGVSTLHGWLERCLTCLGTHAGAQMKESTAGGVMGLQMWSGFPNPSAGLWQEADYCVSSSHSVAASLHPRGSTAGQESLVKPCPRSTEYGALTRLTVFAAGNGHFLSHKSSNISRCVKVN